MTRTGVTLVGHSVGAMIGVPAAVVANPDRPELAGELLRSLIRTDPRVALRETPPHVVKFA